MALLSTYDSPSSSSDVRSSTSKILIGPPRLTSYEKARIVGARALQIALGAPILINVEGEKFSSIDIAIMELESGVLPLTIRRVKPDGSWQDIPLSWLIGGIKRFKY
ncbi:MAG: DNA-directed RNA polymerase subunit K [archaeon GBS-70-058]|nr:DNA-directed RNA polymerase subunit K [Candidatus Culexarchaeum nevadense]